MKKLLVLIPDYGIPHHVMQWAIDLSKKEPCYIQGLFIGDAYAIDTEGYGFPSDIHSTDRQLSNVDDKQDEENLLKTQIKLFEEVCRDAPVDFGLQKIAPPYFDVIVDATIFADLVLCDGTVETEYFSMKSFLAAAHCPVIMVPPDASFFDNIIFSYDDHISSIQAIKHFTAQFPWTAHKKVQLVSIMAAGKEQLDFDTQVREYLKLHYAEAEVLILHGNVQQELSQIIIANKSPLVVMGAFGRSALSRLFKESMAFQLMESVRACLFISHA